MTRLLTPAPGARLAGPTTPAPLLTSSTLAPWRAQHRGPIVFANGVFDLLHPGHVELLAAARALGDRLVVAINSDDSVRALKGAGRPIRTAESRAAVLRAMRVVDAVVIFDQPTPISLIRALRPDVLVKGAEYDADTIVGAEEVHGWGGRVVTVPMVPGESTTGTIRAIEALRLVDETTAATARAARAAEEAVAAARQGLASEQGTIPARRLMGPGDMGPLDR